MSVRQQKRRDPDTGKTTMCWIMDVTLPGPDGRPVRVREVPRIQTRRGAEQYERQRLAELVSSPYQPKEEVPAKTEATKSPTVKLFAKQFVETYAETNNKPSEVASKRMILDRHLVPALGDLRLDEIGPGQIERYKAEKMRIGLSPKSINNHLIVLRKMLSVAEDWGMLERVPRVKWMKVPEAEFDFLSFKEAEQLRAAAEGDWRVMVTVALKAGLRQGELLALRWKDVDFGAGKIVVRQSVWKGIVGTPKGGRSREVELSPDVARVLKAHRHLRGELVFCDADGSMLTKNQCRRPLRDMCKRAELREIGWHVLRHTFASHLVMRGVPIKVVQELLGHRDITTTMRYAHLAPETRQNAVALLDDAVNEATVRQQNRN